MFKDEITTSECHFLILRFGFFLGKMKRHS